ncbi:MAG: YihY/virulence factor BrkB family protein [Gemmatimonadota bacterium]
MRDGTRAAAARETAGGVPLPTPQERLRHLSHLLRATARRAWKGMAEDNIFFMAGGVAFSIQLAIVPFALLLIAGLTWVLDLTPDASALEVRLLLDRFLPAHEEIGDSSIHSLVDEAIRTRGAATFYGALVYIWASTRLFGSLRAVLGRVFDRESERGILWGKWFDMQLSIYATVMMVAYAALTLYLAAATTRGISLLVAIGIREETMGRLEYYVGRALAFTFIAAMFAALYKFLPKHRIRWRQAIVGALASALLFEVARNVWTAITKSYDPGSLYSGTLYAIVSVVFWVYYAALIFIVGAEVSQAYELSRREEDLQRAAERAAETRRPQ